MFYVVGPFTLCFHLSLPLAADVILTLLEDESDVGDAVRDDVIILRGVSLPLDCHRPAWSTTSACSSCDFSLLLAASLIVWSGLLLPESFTITAVSRLLVSTSSFFCFLALWCCSSSLLSSSSISGSHASTSVVFVLPEVIVEMSPLEMSACALRGAALRVRVVLAEAARR